MNSIADANSSMKMLEKDINECRDFAEVATYRDLENQVQKNSHNNYGKILTDIYREPTHFIYELLQNADNVRATKAHIELKNNRLIFTHDGKDEFTLKNVISITGIGNSSYVETHKVGGFGVGFKAVFAISKRPEVYSRDFNFAIESLTVPVAVKPAQIEEGYTTKFIIPFSSEKYTNTDIYKRVKKELNALDITTIMFLFRLKTVTISMDGHQKEISLSSKKLKNAVEYTDSNTCTHYLAFRRTRGKETYNIAYQLDDDREVTEPTCLYISSFFPTKMLSDVNMIVDAPFELATTRESISFEDQKNIQVLKEIKTLFKSSLETLKDLKILTPYTISMMPLEENPENALAQTLYEGFKEAMKTRAYIPTTDGKFAKASTVFVPEDNELVSLTKNVRWANVQYDIDDFYIKELGMRTYGLDNLIKNLSTAQLKQKSDEWLYEFYSYVYDCYDKNEYAYRFLLKSPIFKTRTNSFAPAKDQNSLANLFRKSNGVSNAHTIHTIFTTQSENVPGHVKRKMLDLLELFEIQERSPKTTIESTILNKWQKADTPTRIKLFHQIAEIYNHANTVEKDDIVKLLKSFNQPLILAKKDGKSIWTDEKVYQNTEDLRLIYKNIPNVAFVDKRIWSEKYEEKPSSDGTVKRTCLGTSELCRALGVTDQFIFHDFSSYYYDGRDADYELSESLKKRLGFDKDFGKYWTSRTHYIENFEKILSGVNSPEKTKALVCLLTQIPAEFLEGEIGWTPPRGYSNYSNGESIPSDPFVKLNEQKWCYIDGKNQKFLYQLTKDEFVELCQLSGKEPFLKQLFFKSDARSKLRREEQEILDLYDELSDEERKKFIEKLKNETADERESQEDIAQTIELDDIVMPKLIGGKEKLSQTDSTDTISGGKIAPLKLETKATVVAKKSNAKPSLNKIIGDYNEKVVMKYLASIYPPESESKNGFISKSGEAVTLLGGSHKGYDIRIAKNSEIVSRIEVKSFEDGYISISPTEWEYAKKYRSSYSIYRVKRISGSPCEISIFENPYQMVAAGRLEIVPAGLKVISNSSIQ